MVHITENKYYYPPLTGVPSTLIICKLSWNNNTNMNEEEEEEKEEKKKKKRKNVLLLE